MTEHPGTIRYYDGNTGELVKEQAIADVPERMRFVQTPDGEVPVVRVVATTNGPTRSIVEFGPLDQVLRTTGQFRPDS